MPPQIAAVLFAVGIVGLFWLDRERDVQISKALWVPTLWVLVNASRPVSEWLVAAGWDVGPTVASVDLYLDGSPIDRNVFLVLLGAGVAVLIGRREAVKQLLQQNKAVLIFFGYCTLSILWSDYPYIAFKHWTKGIGDLVMVFVVVTEPEVKEGIKRLLVRLS